MKAHELARLLLETEDIEVKIEIFNEHQEVENTYLLEDVELKIEVLHSSKGLIKTRELFLRVMLQDH